MYCTYIQKLTSICFTLHIYTYCKTEIGTFNFTMGNKKAQSTALGFKTQTDTYKIYKNTHKTHKHINAHTHTHKNTFKQYHLLKQT